MNDCEQIRTIWTHAEPIIEMGVWDPAVFLSNPVRAISGQSGPILHLGELAKVFEGVRAAGNWDRRDNLPGSDAGSDTWRGYRQINVGQFELLPGEAWDRPVESGSTFLQPGDVVVRKMSPVRAALVTDDIPGHPVDDSCLVIRGLDTPTALWVVLCFNHPSYERYLMSLSGQPILPRVSLRVLRNIALPPPPPLFHTLAGPIKAEVNDRALIRRNVHSVQQEVIGFVAESGGADFIARAEARFQQPSWSAQVHARTIDWSWAPQHVSAAILQDELLDLSAWTPLAAWLDKTPRDRRRLPPDFDRQVHLLRLSDAETSVLPACSLETIRPTLASRVYRVPLSVGEVLISTLGTSPRVLFAGVESRDDVFLVDHWEPLRFRETPGAFALILNTPAVSGQLRRMSVGSARQFVRAEDIKQLCIPDVPLAVRTRWDQALTGIVQAWRKSCDSWEDLMNRANRAFEDAHNLPAMRADRSRAL